MNTTTGEAKWQDASGLPTATTASEIVMYDGANYVVVEPTKDKFTGITGTGITLSSTPAIEQDNVIDVYKNGLLLEETDDYTVSGTAVTLVVALIASDKVTVKYFA